MLTNLNCYFNLPFVCLSVFGPLIDCVLIPPPHSFLMIFFAQNLNFLQSFHKNPKFKFTESFQISKMTNTRGLCNYKFALLNRGRCWTSRILIPPPNSFFRIKPQCIQLTHKGLTSGFLFLMNFSSKFILTWLLSFMNWEVVLFWIEI